MKPKNYLLLGSIVVLLIALVILSYSMPNIAIISVIKDISIALTLSVSIAFNIKLNISYKKYETNIKEMTIQNQNVFVGNEKDARSNLLLNNDNLIITKVIDAYKPIEWYFKQHDFTTPHPGDLFKNLINMIDGDFKDSTFRFSDSELDSLLKKLVKSSETFVHFMCVNVYPQSSGWFVTKYCDKRKEGYPDSELKELKAIDEKMYNLVNQCVDDYVKIIDVYYKKYTPHP